ncbi:gag-protease polyprotein, partial [Trifolium medium]|nr:gag-protease polyprotein [Trifolium medium]
MDKRPRTNAEYISQNISRNNNFQRKTKTDEKSNQGKGVQCHEFEGYGHIISECPTFLKRQKNSLTVSWSDEEESAEEVDSETAKHIKVLTGICMSDEESCEVELTYDE